MLALTANISFSTVYSKLYENNFMRLKTDPWFMTLASCLIAFQMSIQMISVRYPLLVSPLLRMWQSQDEGDIEEGFVRVRRDSHCYVTSFTDEANTSNGTPYSS